MLRLALLCSSALLLAASPALAGSWQRPVDGPLLRAFAVMPSHPYARGQHRGVDLGAAPGTAVRSACAGRVSFAGRVPGGGRTVSVRCGELVATYQQLGAVSVRAGRRVGRGASLGSAGASGDVRLRRPHVHLGVREARTGRYLDPLALLGGGGDTPLLPLPPPSARRWPGADPRGTVPRAPFVRAPRAVPLGPAPVVPLPRAAWAGGSPSRIGPSRSRVGSDPVPGAPVDPGDPADPMGPVGPYRMPEIPWFVWAGLACVALAMPIGGLVAVRRQRRRAAARAHEVRTT